jgi:hypothetical protein
VGTELLGEEELSCSANVSAKSGRMISASWRLQQSVSL